MRLVAIVIILSLIATGSAGAAVAARVDGQEADAWRKVAETIPLGSKVKIQTYEGKRVTGTLMGVDGNEILVKRNTRRPEPAVAILFDDISKLERDQNNGNGGINFAKAVGIAAATGGAIVLTLFLLALQLD